MKTLDEVITEFDICEKYLADCPLCEYGGHMCMYIQDALHYLKEYRSDKIQFENDRKNWRDVSDKWDKDYLDARNKYIKALAELKQNDPLSWEELKQMEGKPVWVEDRRIWKDIDLGEREWYLIDHIDDNAMICRACNGDSERMSSDFINVTWQAYRKERK